MEIARENILLLLISEDSGTIGSVATNLDYNQFLLLIAGNAGNCSSIIERSPVGILMLDIQARNVDQIWKSFQEKASRLPVVLITPREVKFEDLRYRVDEIIYKPLDPLEMDTRLASLKKIIEMEQQLSGEKLFFTKNPSILLVEDSAVQRRVLTRQLAGQGFAVHAAADGEEALEIAGRLLPDVVLLDLMLPKMDGFEVCRRLKASRPTADIPVVFITSRQSVEEKIKGLECGAHDFLVKPVNPQELLIRIKSLLRHKQLLETLTLQARKDPLTGLDNRRQLMSDLQLEIQRAERYQTPLSLILLDVDYFKKYNDLHGHPAGDRILRQLANLLAINLRAFDKIARYGGEEFVIILPQTDLKGATVVAEKLRRLVEEYPFPEEETQPAGKLTISLGVASYPEHAKSGDDLLAQADRAMYRAKAAGRNRVAVAGGGEESGDGSACQG